MVAIEQTCSSCGNAYLIPVAEQQFRQTRNLALPETCPECRSLDRSRRNADLLALHERSRIDVLAVPEGRGGRSNSGRNGGTTGRGSNGRSQMYNTVCSQCGAETQVPFVPRGDRPVYCRDCYNAHRGR